MNYIREAEKYLWYYRDLQYSLKQFDAKKFELITGIKVMGS